MWDAIRYKSYLCKLKVDGETSKATIWWLNCKKNHGGTYVPFSLCIYYLNKLNPANSSSFPRLSSTQCTATNPESTLSSVMISTKCHGVLSEPWSSRKPNSSLLQLTRAKRYLLFLDFFINQWLFGRFPYVCLILDSVYNCVGNTTILVFRPYSKRFKMKVLNRVKLLLCGKYLI